MPKITLKIKKLPLILFMFLSTTTFGQFYANHDYYNRLIGGVVGGVGFSQVDGDGYKGYDKLGFTGGGILYMTMGDVNLPFEGTVAFSFEVMYSQKGAKGKGGVPNGGITAQQIQMHYGEIPIQINIFRGTRKSNIGTGFSLGYLGFSEELITTITGEEIKDGYPFRKLDLNYVLTGNIHLWKGIFLSPRFQYSMISVRNNNKRFGGRNEQFNNMWSIRLMYLFK